MTGATNVPNKQLPSTGLGNATSLALLSALQSAHRLIDVAFAEMEHVACGDLPDVQRFSVARMRIAQANLARRRLIDRIVTHLTSAISTEEWDAVRDLRRRDESCFQKVSELVRHWTPEAVTSDWAGYCVASKSTRAGILQIVTAERELLYPLLANMR